LIEKKITTGKSIIMTRCDGTVRVRAFALKLIGLGLILSSNQTERLKTLIFTASMLEDQKDNVENKPASSLVVSLGMALSRTPLP